MKKVFIMLFAASAMIACSEGASTEEVETEVMDTTVTEEVEVEIETTEDVVESVNEMESEIDAIESEVDELING